MKVKACLCLLVLIIAAALTPVSCSEEPQTITAGDGTVIEFENLDVIPPMLKDVNKKYTATIEVEGKGSLVLELFAKDAPKTVSNFVYLAVKGYYNGSTFHRVLPDFMAQGGDPTGTGSGGPGWTFGNEINSHKHVPGALSMANTGQPNSNGSQFFITYVATSWLDGKHTVFGQLTEGMDVLKSLTPRDPSKNPSFKGDKVTRITIKEE